MDERLGDEGEAEAEVLFSLRLHLKSSRLSRDNRTRTDNRMMRAAIARSSEPVGIDLDLRFSVV